MNYIVNPAPETIEGFAAETVDDRPIVMVNLLRFRDQADYESTGLEAPPASGKRAYGRYSKAVIPLLLEVGGYVVWMGRVRGNAIVPEHERWDEVALVVYPSRAAFLKMIRSEAYQRVIGHRTAALLDSRLIETRPSRVPRRLLRLAGLALRAKALVAPRVR